MQGYEEAEVLTISTNDPKEQWIMDSACSYHMSPKRYWFFDFEGLDSGQVLMGNNQSCRIHGVGSVNLKMWDGSVKVITEVRFIPDLKRNLISLGTLDKKRFQLQGTRWCTEGYKKILGNHEWKLGARDVCLAKLHHHFRNKCHCTC